MVREHRRIGKGIPTGKHDTRFIPERVKGLEGRGMSHDHGQGIRQGIVAQVRKKESLMKRDGQPGHGGHHMPGPMESNEVVLHHPLKCIECVRFDECSRNNFSCGESGYVIDPVMSKRVTEHRIMRADRCLLGDDREPR